MSEALKPCPRCGCAAGFFQQSAGMPNTQAFDKWMGVCCKHCRLTMGTSTRRFRDRADAAAAWNLRVGDAHLIDCAQDLLGLVQETLSIGKSQVRDVYGSEFLESAQAAIARATGKGE